MKGLHQPDINRLVRKCLHGVDFRAGRVFRVGGHHHGCLGGLGDVPVEEIVRLHSGDRTAPEVAAYPLVLAPGLHQPRGNVLGATVKDVLAAHPVERPVGAAVADRLGGPTVDELPVDPVRAYGHAQPAALPPMERVLVRAAVVAIDAQEPHLVAATRVRVTIVAVYAEDFVEVWDSAWFALGGAAADYQVCVLPVDVHNTQPRFGPGDAVVALGVPHVSGGMVPRTILVPVAEHRAVNDGHLVLPRLGRPQDRVAGVFSHGMNLPGNVLACSDQVVVEEQLPGAVQGDGSVGSDAQA